MLEIDTNSIRKEKIPCFAGVSSAVACFVLLTRILLIFATRRSEKVLNWKQMNSHVWFSRTVESDVVTSRVSERATSWIRTSSCFSWREESGCRTQCRTRTARGWARNPGTNCADYPTWKTSRGCRKSARSTLYILLSSLGIETVIGDVEMLPFVKLCCKSAGRSGCFRLFALSPHFLSTHALAFTGHRKCTVQFCVRLHAERMS